MNGFYIRWVCALLAVAIVPAASAVTAATPVEAGGGVEAIWKPQQLVFDYRADGTMYSCQSLRQRVEQILLSVGARDGVVVRSGGCDNFASTARLYIALEHPVEATAENLLSVTTYDSKDALIARLRGGRLVAAEDVPRFAAVWTKVSFARERRLRLTGGDCDLVRQLRKQILTKLSVRILKDSSCAASVGRGTPPRLTVLALVPDPALPRVTSLYAGQ